MKTRSQMKRELEEKLRYFNQLLFEKEFFRLQNNRLQELKAEILTRKPGGFMQSCFSLWYFVCLIVVSSRFLLLFICGVLFVVSYCIFLSYFWCIVVSYLWCLVVSDCILFVVFCGFLLFLICDILWCLVSDVLRYLVVSYIFMVF